MRVIDTTIMMKRNMPRFFDYHPASTHKQIAAFKSLGKGTPNPLSLLNVLLVREYFLTYNLPVSEGHLFSLPSTEINSSSF